MANTDVIMQRTFFIGVYPGLDDAGGLRRIGLRPFMRGERAG
jgi:hypothetical protein